MTSPHSDPERYGVRFGDVVVTVDESRRDCVVIAPQPTRIADAPRKMRLHSIEEIRGAWAIQNKLGKDGNQVAADIANALRFAGEKLTPQQRKKR
jgi:hypothetical protein